MASAGPCPRPSLACSPSAPCGTLAAATDLAGTALTEARRELRSFLDRVYFDLRTPGATSRERALNFAATNAFQAARVFARTVEEGRILRSIEMVRSPICRPHGDCWDLELEFIHTLGGRARRIFRLTLDVSDVLPVSVGQVRTWVLPGTRRQ